MSRPSHTRRGFLASVATAGLSFLFDGRIHASSGAGAFRGTVRRGQKHPDPRPGVDGARVLPADKVPEDVRALYDHVREIPHVADGIRCQCGCAELESFYSLLSCYEESGMAQHCAVCQGVGELVFRMHGEGRTLEEIRAAVDRRNW